MADQGAEPKYIEADSLTAVLEALLVIASEKDGEPGAKEEPVVINRTLLMQVRQAMLMIADAIERDQGITPRTSDLRRGAKGR